MHVEAASRESVPEPIFFRLDVEVLGEEGWAADAPVDLFGWQGGLFKSPREPCEFRLHRALQSWKCFQLSTACLLLGAFCPSVSRVPSFKGGQQVWDFWRIPSCLPWTEMYQKANKVFIEVRAVLWHGYLLPFSKALWLSWELEGNLNVYKWNPTTQFHTEGNLGVEVKWFDLTSFM